MSPESPESEIRPTPHPGAEGGPAVPAAQERSVVRRLWDVFRREPMLLVTCSYLFVSIVGLWDSYWFYRRFDIPILEYMQSSDYFVSGLRRPVYVVLLGWTLLASAVALWPERWRQRNPHRVADMERRWWGRLVFPRRSDWWAYFGLHPETMATLSALMAMAVVLFSYGTARGEAIHAGSGNVVSVQGTTESGELAGEWRMLGTSSAYVFLWNPGERRSVVVPIESVARITPLGRGKPAAAPAGGEAPPAGDVAPE